MKALNLTLILSLLLFSASVVAEEFEFYEVRPDILSVEAKAQDLGENWEKLKKAHFAFITELLVLYPDHDLYFLARDSELLYDTARIVTEGTKDAERMHLINVSRANMRDPHLKAYLQQNGITEEAIAQGKKVMFIDTGFSGTIPRVIKESFPDSKLSTHLIASSNPNHPSSRVFLSYLNPLINNQSPGAMHGTVVNYEHLPRYTDRSFEFRMINGKISALSSPTTAQDGTVSRPVALQYMEDLKHQWTNQDFRREFVNLKSEFIHLLTRLRSENNEQTAEAIKNQLEASANKRILEAFLRDSFEAEKQVSLKLILQPEDLSLKIDTNQSSYGSNKNALIEKYPEWKDIFEDPETKIRELVEKEDWQTLGNLIDVIEDAEFSEILAKWLFQKPATGPRRALQEAMIKSDQHKEILPDAVFSWSHSVEMTDLLMLLIENATELTRSKLAGVSFHQPHAAAWKEAVTQVIYNGGSHTHQILAQRTFSMAYTKKWEDLVQVLIQKGNPNVLRALAEDTFSKPHTAGWTASLRSLIETGDQQALSFLALHTFSQPHTAKMHDLIEILIQRADVNTLRKLALETFSKPHTSSMKDLVQRLIERDDHYLLQMIAIHVFSKPHSSEWTDLILMLIETENQPVLQQLAKSIFSKPHEDEMIELKKLFWEKADAHTRKSLMELGIHFPDCTELLKGAG